MIEDQNAQRTEEISQGMFQVRSLIKMLTNCRGMNQNQRTQTTEQNQNSLYKLLFEHRYIQKTQ